tara:strand:+ start:689 stop:1039 length:351 start_codon:yes stop_codon:yes gene_type:complete
MDNEISYALKMQELRSNKVSREQMMEWIENALSKENERIGYGATKVRTSEDWNDESDYIWLSGESYDTYKGDTIYSYYSESSKYEFGVLNTWENELKKRGWYSQWYDSGTIMIYPI